MARKYDLSRLEPPPAEPVEPLQAYFASGAYLDDLLDAYDVGGHPVVVIGTREDTRGEVVDATIEIRTTKRSWQHRRVPSARVVVLPGVRAACAFLVFESPPPPPIPVDEFHYPLRRDPEFDVPSELSDDVSRALRAAPASWRPVAEQFERWRASC